MKKLKLTKEIIQERLNNKGLNIVIIGKFLGIHEKTLFKCLDCGFEFMCNPNNLTKTGKSQGCPNCAKNKYGDYHRLNIETVNKKMAELGNTFEVLKNENIKNQKSTIQIKCKECGAIFKYSVNHIITHKVLCKNCQTKKISNGETIIENLLIKNNIIYKHDCMIEKINNRRLRFDFIIYEDNHIKYLIEFDGKQHYFENCTFGNKLNENKYNLKYYQEADMLKNEYAKNKNIPLLRIKYDQINDIENLLKIHNII